jgi:metal-dependent amidase/aminoacylase/carboxypeptidase family protein
VRIAAVLCTFLFAATLRAEEDTPSFIDKQIPSLVETYEDLHAHPELSHHEERTSAVLAKGLREVGYAVADHIGRYPDASDGRNERSPRAWRSP